MTPGQIAYREFLNSDFWQELTFRKKESVGWKCEWCGARSGLVSHHTSYPRDWYDTTFSHLLVLCHDCHGAIHGVDAPVKPEPVTPKATVINDTLAVWQLADMRSRGEITRQEFQEAKRRVQDREKAMWKANSFRKPKRKKNRRRR